MYEDTVVSFSHPDRVSIEDPLTAVLRSGARRLLAEAVEAEVEAFIAAHVDLSDEAGRRRVVRHGYLPEREVQTGIGAVSVRRPRVRDRQADAGDGRIRFTSSTLPPYLRRAKSVEELLPVNGGEKWDRRGGVTRDHSVFEACPGSPREGPARGAACPSMGDAAARVGGACGPTRTSGGVVVGSAAV